MAKHRYTYHGDTTVHLPLHGITAQGGDSKTIYETDVPINNPDFKAVKQQESERKERSKSNQ